MDKADFDSKTVTCIYNVNIPIKKFKHGMKPNSPENCKTTYPLENNLPSFETYVSSIYKDKNYLSGIDKDRLDSYISRYPLENDTVNYYNNIAFYLIEGGFPKSAIYLLENIVNKFKDREVAYINLGDAYLEVNERDKALQMYSIYVSKMKKKGKEKEIPSRVLKMVGG
ncbi:tetratricopeptide repeat protein [Actinobacillus equuli]|uniref:tetratricopeptide repeat protein n=1 Tax=Actinobacillus equuli TaxID=718 RepID=UPI00244323D5|nr:tetratricopeptide repeat protein [Actinobacillus equuli]WGE42564.1 tetratricopeptide repeat protein [Actinobacillus equuli subsp. haemolyticus]WGE46910.1 tetratricopeptide repeat protein [Actinobacillus equuli subsp. haemolyticus]